MFGKEKCLLLKKIRERIDDDLHVDFECHKCFFEYECSYKCPDYENELELLEKAINKKRKGLKKIRIRRGYFRWDDFIIRYEVENKNSGCFVGHIPQKHILSDDIDSKKIISDNDSLGK